MTSPLTNATRPSTGKTSYHRDNSVTYWSVYSQTWQRASAVSDCELAAMSHDERERVLRHTVRA
jgi:hypothetical protein